MKTTGFSRVSKDLIIRQVEKDLQSHSVFFLTGHAQVPAVKMDKLRSQLRASKARYVVVKNRLGQKALERTKHQDFVSQFTGACGITFTDGDPVASCKVLVDFAKENEAFKIHSGYLDGQVMAAEQVRALASLPSRQVLLTQVVSRMQSPITGLVQVLAGTLRKLVTVVDAIAKQKGGNS